MGSRADPLGLDPVHGAGDEPLQPVPFVRTASIDTAEHLLARDLALLLNDDFDM